jgi:hypothetical protein
MRLQNALNYLNHLIGQGAEFPDAFNLTCWKFRLEPEEWDELKIMYDAEEN